MEGESCISLMRQQVAMLSGLTEPAGPLAGRAMGMGWVEGPAREEAQGSRRLSWEFAGSDSPYSDRSCLVSLHTHPDFWGS